MIKSKKVVKAQKILAPAAADEVVLVAERAVVNQVGEAENVGRIELSGVIGSVAAVVPGESNHVLESRRAKLVVNQ